LYYGSEAIRISIEEIKVEEIHLMMKEHESDLEASFMILVKIPKEGLVHIMVHIITL
jgi:hypothetical protein